MFPKRRMRRARSRNIQPLLREITLTKNDLAAPLFVDEMIAVPKPIDAMPGQSRYRSAASGVQRRDCGRKASGRYCCSGSRRRKTRKGGPRTTRKG